jgi:hypothetical protein
MDPFQRGNESTGNRSGNILACEVAIPAIRRLLGTLLCFHLSVVSTTTYLTLKLINAVCSQGTRLRCLPER